MEKSISTFPTNRPAPGYKVHPRCFYKLMEAAVAGRTVLQVDNGRATWNEGKVMISAESFKDAPISASWAFLDPSHPRGIALRSFSGTKGERMSVVWVPNMTSIMPLRCTEEPLYKTCLRTLRANSLSWVAPAPSEEAARSDGNEIVPSPGLAGQ